MEKKDNTRKKYLFGLKIQNKKRLTVAAVVLVVLIILISGFLVYAGTYSKIMPHTSVCGVNIGGMQQSAAAQILDEKFGSGAASREINFVCNDKSKTVMLSELGVSTDTEKTAKDAYEIGRSGGFFAKTARLAEAAFKHTKLPLEINADETLIDNLVSELAADYETEVKNTSYQLDGNYVVITRGEAGKRVDRAKVLAAVKNAVENSAVSEIKLEVEDAEPAEVDADKFYEELTSPAKDAYYKKENGQVVVVDDVPQIKVDKSEVKKALKSGDEVVRIPVEIVRAEKTTQVLKSLLFRDTMGSFSSKFASSTAARAANVTLAASRINGYILMPGEVFSYDKTIGRRTAANGYKEAGVYIGNKVESGIGGGICQTSSTLYSAALYANLEIVSRTSHSLPVSYVPAGQDATIAEGYIDLKLKNNTDYPVKIVATVSGRTVTCSIVGVKTQGQTVEIVNTKTGTLSPKTTRTYSDAIPQGYKKVIKKGAEGYTVSSKRIVRLNGEVVKTENLTNSRYNATDFEEEVNPADKDKPSESLTIYTGAVKEEPQPSVPANGNGNAEESGSAPSQKPSETPSGEHKTETPPSDNSHSGESTGVETIDFD